MDGNPQILIGWLAVLVALAAILVSILMRRKPRQEEPDEATPPPVTSPYPSGPLPREVIRRRLPRGACGVIGCKNMKPHSHVMDLVKKIAPHRVPK